MPGCLAGPGRYLCYIPYKKYVGRGRVIRSSIVIHILEKTLDLVSSGTNTGIIGIGFDHLKSFPGLPFNERLQLILEHRI